MKKQLPLPADNRAVGYIRGSTEEQRNTLQAQDQQITTYCAYKKLELVRNFTDSGTSAYSVPFRKRPVIQQTLEFMQEQDIRQLVITKLDRAFRSAKDCLNTIEELEAAGIQLHILDLNVDTREPQGRFFLTVMAALAELENGIRAQRQKDNFAVMRQNFYRTGTVPYGWTAVTSIDRVSRTKRPADNLVPNPAEQTILREILGLHARGHGDHAIAQELNALRVPSKKGGCWYASTVQSVREHARLAGPDGNAETLPQERIAA